MISRKSLNCYKGIALSRGDDFLYVLPNALLRPYVSCYTLTFPTHMPDHYTLIPSASSTMVIALNGQKMVSSLRGVNTKICTVGKHANKMELLLLIEFHSGCLYPFIKADSSDLANLSFELAGINKELTQAVENALLESESIEALFASLDKLFLSRIKDFHPIKTVSALKSIIACRNGNISTRELASEFFYSEKHLRRLFLQYIGTNPKTFSRLVRVNYAMQLLQNKNKRLTDIALQTGFFDQPHFIHDFTSVCGIAPQNYLQSMSDFYNDNYKF